MKDIKYVSNFNTLFQFTNFSTKCSRFQPPMLKINGGNIFLVGKIQFLECLSKNKNGLAYSKLVHCHSNSSTNTCSQEYCYDASGNYYGHFCKKNECAALSPAFVTFLLFTLGKQLLDKKICRILFWHRPCFYKFSVFMNSKREMLDEPNQLIYIDIYLP